MGVGAAGNNLDAATGKGLRQGSGIRLDLGGVGFERGLKRLAKTDGLGGNHLHVNATLHAGEYGGLKFGAPVGVIGKNNSAARAAQGFGRRAGNDIGMGQG